MKELFYVFALYIVLGFAEPAPKLYLPKEYVIDDKETLKRQEDILLLFKNINQPSRQIKKPLHNFRPENKLNLYKEPTIVKQFLQQNKLQKGEIFSVYHQSHLEEAILLFKMLYYANDFDTFYETALWARQNVNEGLFLYSTSVALVHRSDTFGLILPPIYEVNPYYFFSSEIINKAQMYKQKYDANASAVKLIINDNPTDRYTNQNPEQQLAYFTEDLGLNSFYYYYHIFYPWWMDGKEFGLAADGRGEIFYFIMAQSVARGNLERLSNGLEEISAVDFESHLDEGYYPSLRYPNGVEFPSRPNGVNLKGLGQSSARYSNFSNAYRRVRDFAFRIQNVVDLGRAYYGVEIYKDEIAGLEILSNLLEGNPNSPDLPYYGTLQTYARHLLGYAPEPLNRNKRIPASIEHYETSLRDPATWKLFKWFLDFYRDFYEHCKPYTQDELEFPGVKIDAIDVNEWTTFFDFFLSDLSNAVCYSESSDADEEFNINVYQKRLNHSPLIYNVTITSDKSAPSLIKVFLGPKYDKYGQSIKVWENQQDFYLLDYFLHNLKTGVNVITRNVNDGASVGDRTTYRELHDKVADAIYNNKEFTVNGGEAFWAFPNRLLIPKGTPGGMEFQLYVIVAPLKGVDEIKNYSDERTYKKVGTGRHSFNYTLRYPLDKKMPSSLTPNSFITDIVIRHEMPAS